MEERQQAGFACFPLFRAETISCDHSHALRGTRLWDSGELSHIFFGLEIFGNGTPPNVEREKSEITDRNAWEKQGTLVFTGEVFHTLYLPLDASFFAGKLNRAAKKGRHWKNGGIRKRIDETKKGGKWKLGERTLLWIRTFSLGSYSVVCKTGVTAWEHCAKKVPNIRRRKLRKQKIVPRSRRERIPGICIHLLLTPSLLPIPCFGA